MTMAILIAPENSASINRRIKIVVEIGLSVRWWHARELGNLRQIVLGLLPRWRRKAFLQSARKVVIMGSRKWRRETRYNRGPRSNGRRRNSSHLRNLEVATPNGPQLGRT